MSCPHPPEVSCGKCDGWAEHAQAVEEIDAVREYDHEYGIESDPYAGYKQEQHLEFDGTHDKPNLAVIAVEPMQSRDWLGRPVLEGFYVTPREARCLAASLLRAADEADEDLED